MIKRVLKLAVLIIFLSIFPSGSMAQDDSSISGIAKRVQVLEDQREILRDNVQSKLNTIDQKFDIKSREIDLEVKENIQNLNDEQSYLKTIVKIFGSFTIVGIILGIINFFIRAHKIAERTVEKKFEKLFDDDKDKLISLINAHDEEFQLKQKKSILVVSGKDSNDDFLKKFFDKMGFKKTTFKKMDVFTKVKGENLIFFNNEDDELPKPLMTDYATKAQKSAIRFYFGSVPLRGPEFKENFAFANSRVQLYGNIINALKYQNLLE